MTLLKISRQNAVSFSTKTLCSTISLGAWVLSNFLSNLSLRGVFFMPSRSQQRLFFTKLYFHQNCLVLFNYFIKYLGGVFHFLLTALYLSEKLSKISISLVSTKSANLVFCTSSSTLSSISRGIFLMPSRSEQRLLCLRGVFLLLLTALYLSEKLLKLIYFLSIN